MKPDSSTPSHLSDVDVERFKIFDHHVAHLLGAIRVCLERGFIIPAMMLTFAGIDGMAWVYRTHDRPSSNGNDFKGWTDKFLIGHLKSGIVNSTDLWAARNALLHVQSSYSDQTKSGRAKSFIYIDSKGLINFPTDQEWTSQPIILTADAIVDRFEVGLGEFRRFIEKSSRIDVILDRCGQWFDYGAPIDARSA